MHNSCLLQLQQKRAYKQNKSHLEAFKAGYNPDLRSKLLHCFCSLRERENNTHSIYSAEQFATNKTLANHHFAARASGP